MLRSWVDPRSWGQCRRSNGLLGGRFFENWCASLFVYDAENLLNFAIYPSIESMAIFNHQLAVHFFFLLSDRFQSSLFLAIADKAFHLHGKGFQPRCQRAHGIAYKLPFNIQPSWNQLIPPEVRIRSSETWRRRKRMTRRGFLMNGLILSCWKVHQTGIMSIDRYALAIQWQIKPEGILLCPWSCKISAADGRVCRHRTEISQYLKPSRRWVNGDSGMLFSSRMDFGDN